MERGHNAFGFRHLTFQEYFAGLALALMDAEARWNLVRPNLHSNRWREPILLSAASIGVSGKRQDQATRLVESILATGSEYENLLHRDLFLAADCAVDDIGIDLPLLRRIVEQLAGLAMSQVPAVSARAVELLSRLSLLRAGEERRVPEAAVRCWRSLKRQSPTRCGRIFWRYVAERFGPFSWPFRGRTLCQ